MNIPVREWSLKFTFCVLLFFVCTCSSSASKSTSSYLESLEGYISILLMSYKMLSGALQSPYLFLSYLQYQQHRI